MYAKQSSVSWLLFMPDNVAAFSERYESERKKLMLACWPMDHGKQMDEHQNTAETTKRVTTSPTFHDMEGRQAKISERCQQRLRDNAVVFITA